MRFLMFGIVLIKNPCLRLLCIDPFFTTHVQCLLNLVGGCDSYDANDNMMQDYNKKIANIEYNSLNLRSRLKLSNGNMAEYVYDATGQKNIVKNTRAKILWTSRYRHQSFGNENLQIQVKAM